MKRCLRILKNSYVYIVLLLIFIFKGNFVYIVENIGYFFTDNKNRDIAEIKMLQNQVDDLKTELKNLSNLGIYAKYNYDLTRVSYRVSYKSDEFYIYGGENKNYKKNYAVINEDGLVGIITDVYKDYSKVKTLSSVTNLSIRINKVYGTISDYKNGVFKVTDISNYDKVRLNDLVYTSTLGSIKESIYIGYVLKIEDNDISKTLYVKSNIDFEHLSYLYVVGEL